MALSSSTARVAGSVAYPTVVNSKRILWKYTASLIAFHLIAILAFTPWFFSWWGMLWLIVGNYLFCSLGTGAGFHRLLVHRSYTCAKWFEYTLSILGVCCLQDSPVRWVVIHRVHHQHSDHDDDPHSPLVTWFWGHMGWVMIKNERVSSLTSYERYAKDLLSDPFYMKLERRSFWIWVYVYHAIAFVVLGAIVGAIATATVNGAVWYAWMFLLWGVIARTVYTWHVTWAVNSFAHRSGYQTFKTKDNSRNNWLFALLTNGDGWHNNHHADPRSAAHGQKWWEIDVTYMTLCLMKRCGIVYDMIPPRAKSARVIAEIAEEPEFLEDEAKPRVEPAPA